YFYSSRRRHTRCSRDWSSDVCSSDLGVTSRVIMKATPKPVRHHAAFAQPRLSKYSAMKAVRLPKPAELHANAKPLGVTDQNTSKKGCRSPRKSGAGRLTAARGSASRPSKTM